MKRLAFGFQNAFSNLRMLGGSTPGQNRSRGYSPAQPEQPQRRAPNMFASSISAQGDELVISESQFQSLLRAID